jgi:glycosyltransferase involved in cell wall biosynthesis
MPVISVVVPVYGCADCLGELHRRLTATLEGMGTSYELVLVDDGSRDDAWEVLRKLARDDPTLTAIRLSRNFGEEAAIAAGLSHASGRYVVVMDCDLQDAPEDIPRLHAAALQGHDVVFTRRAERGHSRARVAASRLYFSLMRRLFGGAVDPAYGNFSMISRRVADAIQRLGDSDRHYRAILAWAGFRQAEVQVDHAPRHAGESAYDLRALIRHAADGVFFQSATLMRYIVYAGLLWALAGLVLAIYFVVLYVAGAYDDPPGWTSLAVLILLTTGSVMITLGVTGLYIGRIFRQVKGRPLFLIDEVVVGEREGGELAPPETYARR